MHELALKTTCTVVGHCDNVSAEMFIHSPSLSEAARHVAVKWLSFPGRTCFFSVAAGTKTLAQLMTQAGIHPAHAHDWVDRLALQHEGTFSMAVRHENIGIIKTLIAHVNAMPSTSTAREFAHKGVTLGEPTAGSRIRSVPGNRRGWCPTSSQAPRYPRGGAARLHLGGETGHGQSRDDGEKGVDFKRKRTLHMARSPVPASTLQGQLQSQHEADMSNWFPAIASGASPCPSSPPSTSEDIQ